MLAAGIAGFRARSRATFCRSNRTRVILTSGPRPLCLQGQREAGEGGGGAGREACAGRGGGAVISGARRQAGSPRLLRPGSATGGQACRADQAGLLRASSAPGPGRARARPSPRLREIFESGLNLRARRQPAAGHAPRPPPRSDEAACCHAHPRQSAPPSRRSRRASRAPSSSAGHSGGMSGSSVRVGLSWAADRTRGGGRGARGACRGRKVAAD
jgi:hypothetical protein